MERVAIVGPGGAGKSTFARELGRRTGLPVTHLDEKYWQPGWVEPSRDVWRQIQRELVAERKWILDGNYGGTLDERLPYADTLIIFGLPRRRYMTSAIARSLKNHGKEIQAAGCPERLQLTFIRYLWRYPKHSRPRLNRAVAEFGTEELRVVEFTSRRAAAAFLGQAVAEEE